MWLKLSAQPVASLEVQHFWVAGVGQPIRFLPHQCTQLVAAPGSSSDKWREGSCEAVCSSFSDKTANSDFAKPAPACFVLHKAPLEAADWCRDVSNSHTVKWVYGSVTLKKKNLWEFKPEISPVFVQNCISTYQKSMDYFSTNGALPDPLPDFSQKHPEIEMHVFVAVLSALRRAEV